VVEYRIALPDGRTRWLAERGQVSERDAAGRATVMRGVVTDVTEHKEAEAELLRREARFRSLIANATDLITILDADGTIRYESPALRRFLGHDPDDLVGLNAFDFVHPDDRAPTVAEFGAALANPAFVPTVEFRFRHADGSWRWLEATGTNLLADPDVGGFVVNSRDVTERRRATDRIERFRRRLELILDSAGEGIFGLDPQGHVAFVNPTALQMLAQGEGDLLGRSMHDLVHHTRPDGTAYPAAACPIHATLADGRVHRIADEVFWRGDGTSFPVEYTSTPIREGEEIVGAVVTFRDATDRKAAEELRARQARRAMLLADVAAALATPGPLEGVLGCCAEAVVRHLGAAFARVWLLDEATQILELKASAGLYTHLDGTRSRIPVGQFKIGLIAQERRPYLTNDTINDPRSWDQEWARREGMVSFAGYPLLVEDRLVGVLALFARAPFGEEDLAVLADAAQLLGQGIERRRAEAALREHAARLAAVVKVQEEWRPPGSTRRR
jgi:PAS domain S-box-containing protein